MMTLLASITDMAEKNCIEQRQKRSKEQGLKIGASLKSRRQEQVAHAFRTRRNSKPKGHRNNMDALFAEISMIYFPNVVDI
jgi:hypothetical protein